MSNDSTTAENTPTIRVYGLRYDAGDRNAKRTVTITLGEVVGERDMWGDEYQSPPASDIPADLLAVLRAWVNRATA